MRYDGYPTGRAFLEGRIVQRARHDPNFLHRLRSDARGALSDVIGTELPSGLEVVVLEERPDLMYVVLPVDLSGMGVAGVQTATGSQYWLAGGNA
jgi:hypothetical protein